MNFKKLYTESKKRIADAIIGLWKETSPKMVELYGTQLEKIISESISKNIVVENMAHWESVCNDTQWHNLIDTKIWRKRDKKTGDIVDMPYPPYKHQFQSWKALLQDEKSIVVTSGTGSGKTECFMVPLVHDLTKGQNNGMPRTEAVEAIFLYPLNALMEDQKERINDYITFSNKHLKFAVYNGNTPETGDSDDGYDNEIVGRSEIRSEKPNILFTNPSMLEYMLLRKKDSALFTDKLKWIVIDETHTFKGSAGAELAMLIRRVIKACGTDVDKIKFATSSATIGSGDDAKLRLKEFISTISGQNIDKIEVVEGFRTEPKIADPKIKKLLQDNGFVLLNTLIPEGSIEEKLEVLDQWTDDDLRIRLHYYIQTMNLGLYINPQHIDNNQFVLSKYIPLKDGELDMNYLDAYYCKECGALLGFGEMNDDGSYHRIVQEQDLSLVDIPNADEEDDDTDTDTDAAIIKSNKFYIGITNNSNSHNSSTWEINDGKFVNSLAGSLKIKRVENKNKGNFSTIHYCPCCGTHGSDNNKPMRSFHMSADYISRLIAPVLLDQTSSATKDQDVLPMGGKKYITFADSRQSASGPTLKQNLETEEVWVTGVLYNKLCYKKKTQIKELECLKDLLELYKKHGQQDKVDDIEKKIKEHKEDFITWNNAIDILLKDPNCERMFLAFAKPDDDRNSEKAKREYVLSALYRVMNRRPAHGANSPENWGLIHTCYPSMEKLKERELPDSIEEFNNHIPSDDFKITKEDWFDYVKLFIDYDIRRNERFFFMHSEKPSGVWNEIDYSATRQYRTEVSSRRPIDGEDKSKIKVGDNRYTKLLLRLLGKDSAKDISSEENDVISGVLDQLKADLERYNIKQVGQELSWDFNKKKNRYELKGWKKSKDDANYMNLTQIAFKLYDDEVWFDNNLRIPLDTTFKCFSPEFNVDTRRYDTVCKIEPWSHYIKDESQSAKEWFTDNRSCIVHKWTNKLGRILDYSSVGPNTLYIQAEHTAQVSRSIIKAKTEKFKKGDINIMACSTTMEMGVDLGDLELVVMNNVPPHPANYKQRAGRAGRGDQNKSAAVTICGCDASGEALMRNPLSGLICTPIEPPFIDLNNSFQLIQRHVNSYLFRKYITDNNVNYAPGVEGENDRGYKVFGLFTSYPAIEWTEQYKVKRVKLSDGNTQIWPDGYSSLINEIDSHYAKFLSKLDAYSSDVSVISEVENLVKGLNLSATQLIQNTKCVLEKIAKNLDEELNSVAMQWVNSSCNVEEKNNPWKRWNYKFTSILNKNLLEYLSTHQFTPNANMPIGIVEMLIDESERHSTDNPSRDMKVALSEYTPGNQVFINGVTYRMGGVQWNHAMANERLKRCSDNHTWLSAEDKCPICKQSPVSWGNGFGDYLEIITPTGFYPYKDTSRITQKDNVSFIIDTALIGVGKWINDQNGARLYKTRTNNSKDTVNHKILYYNKGFGLGYYVCKDCGYAVPVPVENEVCSNEVVIKSLYPIIGSGTRRKERYHNYRGWKCGITENDDIESKLFKNVVFGGTIQTDFCEIALYSDISHRMAYDENKNHMAITLGLMLCREFVKRIGCDRSEVDFIVRKQDSQMSICIFDTAKGGNGYSNKLADSHLLESLFDSIREKLESCTSADMVLDRTTMKYADFINVQETYQWLVEEYLVRKVVPSHIRDKFHSSNVMVSSYEELRRALSQVNATDRCVLFFNGEFINRDWNCREGDVNWMNNREELTRNNWQSVNFATYNLPSAISSYDDKKMNIAGKGKEWYSVNNPLDDLFPIAQIGRTLYFTEDERSSLLNGYWASKDIYSVDYGTIPLDPLNIVLLGNDSYTYKAGTVCYSDDLFEELYQHSPRLQSFITKCRGHKLSFTYHEEFLRNHLGMTMVMQFILKFAEKANSGIEDILIIGETYDDSDYLKRKFSYCYDYKDNPIRLNANCLNSVSRDEYIIDRFIDSLEQTEKIGRGYVESRKLNDLPHWRSLIVKDVDEGIIINILPNGGFANGWAFDNREYRSVGFYPNTCSVYTRIPIKVTDHNGLLYDIKVGEMY